MANSKSNSHFSICYYNQNNYLYHLGSSTFLSDANGQPYQFLLYLPFGETMAEQNVAGYSTPYKFTGKELDEETGLYYYGARYYDPTLSIWHGVDQMSEKHPDFSPFAFTTNNPVRFIDPDGNDWYEDECTGNYKWFKGNEQISGFKHLGETYRNNKDFYRKDGSVLFGSHSNAVRYMEQVSNSPEKKESFGYILNKNNILVTPEAENINDESSPGKVGYHFIKEGKFMDPVENRIRSFKATVHTHPSNGDQIPSSDDLQTIHNFHPQQPGFIIGMKRGSIVYYDNFNYPDGNSYGTTIINGRVTNLTAFKKNNLSFPTTNKARGSIKFTFK